MNDDGDGDCKDLLEDEEKKKRRNKWKNKWYGSVFINMRWAQSILTY